jgi:hypothetical protein
VEAMPRQHRIGPTTTELRHTWDAAEACMEA